MDEEYGGQGAGDAVETQAACPGAEKQETAEPNREAEPRHTEKVPGQSALQPQAAVANVPDVQNGMPPRRKRRKKRKSGTAPWLVPLLAAVAIGLGVLGGAFAAGRLPLPGGGGQAGAAGQATPGISKAQSHAGSGVAGAPSSAAGVPAGNSGTASAVVDSATSATELPDAPVAPRDYQAVPLPEEMRAMWISFLEWKQVDFSSEETARAQVGERFQTCADMGLNTVIVAVRPFGDAFYPSGIYPWSHLLGAGQGQDPGYDPLAVMVEEGHARGLRVEAWLNPYRVQHPTNGPEALSVDNPASLHPEWVRTVEGNGSWYDPGVEEVRALVVDGVLEIVQNYDVDGIHFDDYFYPEGADESFDEDSYARRREQGMDLAAWRRENIHTMVWQVYEAVKAANPSVSFGISTQGNNENNYTQMYADVKHWMANEGYVDYVMPQLYWGFDYSKNGKDTAAFANKCAEWAGYPRTAQVRLYCGLGAYRIGALQPDGTRAGQGDGGDGDQAEWQTGHNLADMVRFLREGSGFSGFALFRYEFLVQSGDALAQAERQALTQEIAGTEEALV